MANYYITLEQHGDAYMQDTRFSIDGRLLGTKQALPAKMGIDRRRLGRVLACAGSTIQRAT